MFMSSSSHWLRDLFFWIRFNLRVWKSMAQNIVQLQCDPCSRKSAWFLKKACCCLGSGLSPARCWVPHKPLNTTEREKDSAWSRSSQYLVGLSLRLIYNKWLHSRVWNEQVKHTLKITVTREKRAYLQEHLITIFVLKSLLCRIPA